MDYMAKERLVEKIISDILKSKKFEGKGSTFFFDDDLIVHDYEEITKNGIRLAYLSSYSASHSVEARMREALKKAIEVKTSVFIKDYMAN
jgi:hypothetical protein